MRLLKPVWVTHGSLSKDSSVGRPIYSLDIHPDGSRLATGGLIDTCGVVILWNMKLIRNPKLEADPNTPRKLFQMDSHQACVNCVRWSPTGAWLASAGMDKVIMLWKKTAAVSRQTTVFGAKEQTAFTEHWRCANVLRGHSGDILDLAWSHDGNRLASSGVDNSVIIWSRQAVTPGNPGIGQFVMLTTLRTNQGFIKGVAWDPVGRYLASQGDEISVKIWRTSDWSEEAVIRKPFLKAVGQSQVMRISWSLDGSTLAVPHAINNGFPTTKLLDRTNWAAAFDLVGHRKHVICTRYCPNLFRKSKNGETQNLVCLALGSKDRSVSVWATSDRRALVVIHDLFTNSVCDLSWSPNGTELMACSLDGTVSYMGFANTELGTPWSIGDLVQLHHKSYGQSLLNKLVTDDAIGDFPVASSVKKMHGSLDQSDIVLETPEALALHQTQAAVCKRLQETTGKVGQSTTMVKPATKGPTKQIESRGKDGRRRITPKFLGHLDSLDENGNSNPQFSSPQSTGHGRSFSTPEDSNSDTVVKPSPDPSRMPPDDAKLNGLLVDGATANTTDRSTINLDASRSSNETSKPVGKPPATIAEKSKISTSDLPGPLSCVTISVNGRSTVTDKSLTQTDISRKRPFDDSDSEVNEQETTTTTTTITVSDEVVVRQKSLASAATKPPPLPVQPKKKRRIRLFDGSEDEPTVGVVDKKGSSQTKSSQSSEVAQTGASPRVKSTSQTESANSSAPASSRPMAVPTANHLVLTTPDQLANQTKVKFVCSHPIDGPLLVELASHSGQTRVNTQSAVAGAAAGTVTGIHRITAHRNERDLWDLVSEHRLTAYAYTDHLIAIGDCTGRVQLLHTNGTSVCPPILLEASVHRLALAPLSSLSASSSSSSTFNPTSMGDLATIRPTEPMEANSTGMSRLHTVVRGGGDPMTSTATPATMTACSYRLVALCQSGRLVAWQIRMPPAACTPSIAFQTVDDQAVFPQFLFETNVTQVVRASPPSLGYASLSFGPDGHLVVHRRDGSSYLFHVENRSWFELFDASNPTRSTAAMSASRNCPSGPLASCQLLNKVGGHQSEDPRTNHRTANQRLIVQQFLQAQTHNAKLFGSTVEYRYWFIRWFRQLVEDNQEEHIRRICQDLIGPVFSAGSRTSWQSTSKGISKHDLARECLSLFAINLRLQRLYVELKEMFVEAQSIRGQSS